LHLDELVRISGEKTAEISARLTIMEMKGMVRSMGMDIQKNMKLIIVESPTKPGLSGNFSVRAMK